MKAVVKGRVRQLENHVGVEPVQTVMLQRVDESYRERSRRTHGTRAMTFAPVARAEAQTLRKVRKYWFSLDSALI